MPASTSITPSSYPVFCMNPWSRRMNGRKQTVVGAEHRWPDGDDVTGGSDQRRANRDGNKMPTPPRVILLGRMDESRPGPRSADSRRASRRDAQPTGEQPQPTIWRGASTKIGTMDFGALVIAEVGYHPPPSVQGFNLLTIRVQTFTQYNLRKRHLRRRHLSSPPHFSHSPIHG